MCARYTLITTKELIEKWFKADVKGELKPVYNAAPGKQMPIILNSEPSLIQFAKWGFYIGDGAERQLIINSRSETVFYLAAFKEAAENRRCLIIADGFYEWKTIGKTKQPFWFTLKNKGVFAFAGIYNQNDNAEITYSLLTTSPNAMVGKVHNRMPVMLDRTQYELWLNADSYKHKKEIDSLFSPMVPEKMAEQLVSPLVNNAQNDGPELLIDRQLGLGW